MKKVIATVELGKGNFSCYVETLPGVIATGDTQEVLEKNMREAVKFHVETSLEEGEKVPAVFKGPYELVFKYEPDAFFAQLAGIVGPAALERITGVNKKLLSHYATGLKKPMPDQREKITEGLHRFGKDLLQMQL